MTFRLSATTLKNYFQYRCERQLRYSLVSSDERTELAIVERAHDAPWAEFGTEFEELVVAELARSEAVLLPTADDKLDRDSTLAFLRRERTERFAHQLRLELVDASPLLGTPGEHDLRLSLAYPDLVEAIDDGENVRFRLIDVKAVHAPTLFHKTQVAFYALLLEQMLGEVGLPHGIDSQGEIWHLADDVLGDGIRWARASFPLKSYRAQVMEFLSTTIPRVLGVQVQTDDDRTFFHLGYKCEQCKYLPHCERSIDPALPRAQWDLSAVAGLSPSSKGTLLELGVRTVGDLATTDALDDADGLGWGLREGAAVFPARAQSLVEGRVARREDRHTYLMPPTVDVGLFLLVDKDPIEGRLASLGYLHQGVGEQRLRVALVCEVGADAERDTLLEILAHVLRDLDEVDVHNRENADADPLIAHLFVYEPSEAVDLREALGRHLDDDGVRRGLLDLIRMFPPEPLQPDPEYKGRRHLPATALRSVLDSLYHLPVRVALDLARVSTALAQATPPVEEVYTPGELFAQPFSSRLNIEVCRALKAGRVDADLVEADVTARLRTLAALTNWLLAENARTSPPFLHLKKEPFRWQTNFHPLTAGDLQVLEAQELLTSRSDELAALTRLSDPVGLRVRRFECLAPLRLTHRDDKCEPWWVASRLEFRAPAQCRQTTLGPGSFGTILTDGSPEAILDPGRWPGLFVTIRELVPDGDGLRLVVEVSTDVWDQGVLPALLEDAENKTFVLDRAHTDFNTPRVLDFLRFLQEEPPNS